MLSQFRASRPNAFIVLLALVTSLFGYIFMQTGFGVFAKSDHRIYMRTVYIAATCLLMFDVVTGASIALGPKRNIKSPHFWILAFYMGFFLAMLTMLIYWDGLENAKRLFIAWGIAGAFFGTITAFLHKPENEPAPTRLNLTIPQTERTLGFLYYIWPVVVILFAVAFIYDTSFWSENYILFQIIFQGH